MSKSFTGFDVIEVKVALQTIPYQRDMVPSTCFVLKDVITAVQKFVP